MLGTTEDTTDRQERLRLVHLLPHLLPNLSSPRGHTSWTSSFLNTPQYSRLKLLQGGCQKYKPRGQRWKAGVRVPGTSIIMIEIIWLLRPPTSITALVNWPDILTGYPVPLFHVSVTLLSQLLLQKSQIHAL